MPHHILLSGGVGSRLWPLSKPECPKQYVSIFGDKSLFQLTALRNQSLTDGVVVVGNINTTELSRKHLQECGIAEFQLISEAIPKNTAAAVAFAALAIDENDIMLVTPSDHMIGDEDKYQTAIKRAFELAEEGYLVTFGITPASPETGYGYIRANGENVQSFHEKPDANTAEQFVADGNYYWNSGIFCFRAGVFLEELATLRPDILQAAKAAMDNQHDGQLTEAYSEKIPSESIDYAVMEKSQKIKMVAGNFSWSDLGSYQALYDYYSMNDSSSSFIQGSNLVITEQLQVESLGLENHAVIQSDSDLLIIPLNRCQEVKQIFERRIK
ncbi:MAG: mannose-1-phosphate guanylyltransferase [Flavobacteriales bacterium]|nr:MAG: mannose-1-phosphate guanylyltransferase [Flavobacteriales bacterium]